MCGIIGLISDSKGIMSQDKRNFINQALVVDSLRGEDSTGLFTVDDTGKVDVFKAAMSGWDFIQHSKTKKMLSSMLDKQLIVGHNRWATKGAINAVNSHPFHHGNIIGVHNGSLRNHTDLLKDGNMFDVDSDAVFHSINEIGVEETVKTMNGAYAIVYYDQESDTVNMFRNEERPLWIGYVEHVSNKDTTILFASEVGMIEWIAGRNNMKVKNYKLLTPHTLYTMSLEDLTNYTTAPLGKYTITPSYSGKGNRQSNKKGNTQVTNISNRRSIRAKKLLEEVGLNVGDDLDFWIYSSSLYGHLSSLGEISGTMVDSPYCDVIVHGVSKEQLKLANTEQALTGKILTANNRANNLEIHIKTDTLRSTYEDIDKKQDDSLKEVENKKSVVKKEDKKPLVNMVDKFKDEHTEAAKFMEEQDALDKHEQAMIKKEIAKSEEKERQVKKEVDVIIAKAQEHQKGKVGKIKEAVDIIKVTEEVRQEKKSRPVLSLQGYRGLNGSYTNLNDHKAALLEGCQNCGCNIEPSDAFNISWTVDNKPICVDCSVELKDSGCIIRK